MSDAELSVTYTWSRALLQLTNLTNTYQTNQNQHNKKKHKEIKIGSFI